MKVRLGWRCTTARVTEAVSFVDGVDLGDLEKTMQSEASRSAAVIGQDVHYSHKKTRNRRKGVNKRVTAPDRSK